MKLADKMSINTSTVKVYGSVPYMFVKDVGAVAEFSDDEEDPKEIKEPKENGWVIAIRESEAARKRAAKKKAEEEAKKTRAARQKVFENLNLILMNLLEKDVAQKEREDATIKTWKTFCGGHVHLVIEQAKKKQARRAGEIAYIKELMRMVAEKLAQ